MEIQTFYVNEIKDKFQFLSHDYQFAIDKIEIDKYYPSVRFLGSNIAIELRLEIREKYFIFYIIKLENNYIPPYLEFPNNWLYIEEIVKFKNSRHGKILVIDLIDENSIRKIINEYVSLCKSYCVELLEGDIDLFNKIVKLRKNSSLK